MFPHRNWQRKILGTAVACSYKRLFTSSASARSAPYRPSTALDEWVQRDARPTSLRQLAFFGRTLTEPRLIESANYVRTELPTRIAHRLRDMQTLPYIVVTNPHISHVYDLYFRAFEKFRKVPEVKSLEDNEQYCEIIRSMLQEHATIIPKLFMGVLEIQGHLKPEIIDGFITALLRSRISRRVIAEQHLALTNTFHSPRDPADSKDSGARSDSVGEIFLRCNAREIVERCARNTSDLIRSAYGSNQCIPEIQLAGHVDAIFPYIVSHLEYVLGELLRNSVQAIVENPKYRDQKPPPIEVLICESSQHVIFRISDQGGGVPSDILPYLWSFSKSPRREKRLENLNQVPRIIGSSHEVGTSTDLGPIDFNNRCPPGHTSSLSSLSTRAPQLRLGIGLPMSRIYAEYWAGSLELHSLEGYGVDCFFQISKLGNKNERLTTRANMDAL